MIVKIVIIVNMTEQKMKKEMLQVLKIIKIDLGGKLINQIDMDGSSYCISIIVSYSFTLMIYRIC